MRKNILIIFFILSVAFFSFAEFVFSPTIGFSSFNLKNTKVSLILNHENFATSSLFSWKPMTVGIAIGSLKSSGFTFLWNNDFSFLGNLRKEIKFDSEKLQQVLNESVDINVESIKIVEKIGKGVFWSNQLLFGYTLRLPLNIHLNFMGGLDLGFGKFDIKLKKIMTMFVGGDSADLEKFKTSKLLISAGIPLQFGIQYYFIKNVGINMAATYIPSYSNLILFSHINAHSNGTTESSTLPLQVRGINHQFKFRIGPIFKF